MGRKKKEEREQFAEKIIPRNIEDEMRASYIDYAMSVIVGRALPDVKDGLKPVHRRILYTMHEMGLAHNKPFKKSARVVGDVLGKYHPHGDMAVYDAMVRMVQEFSLRYPLINGQGNFGSIDGDSPAAMRYTEVRLSQITQDMLGDINKHTVDFTPNYDGSLSEPVILPARLPNLLINGSSGIAVGMATNIPPHNLGEIIDGVVMLIENPEAEITDLMKVIKGPDFPTGALIFGKKGIRDAYMTGRGSIKLRAKAEIEEVKGGKEVIVVDELPYQVNKANLIEAIANLVKSKKVEGISEIRDESDRRGLRIIIEIKKGENAQVILNQLYKHTQLTTTFGVIMLGLVDNVPRILNLKEVLHQYLEHRKEIVYRRTKFELEKAEARAHILSGLLIALENLDKVVKIIRRSKDVETARNALMTNFALTRIQAQAILDMRLHQLTALERKKIEDEHKELLKTIKELKSILASPKKILEIIKQEILEIKEKYGDARRTKIVARAVELDIEDLISEEDVVVTISHAGYIKRLELNTYRTQKRGGRGITGMTTREEDFLENIFISSTHSYVLFFSNLGRLYWLKVYEIPEAARTARGKAIVNLLRLSSSGEYITAMIPVRSFEAENEKEEQYLMMITRKGVVKKTPLKSYSNPRPSGIIAIKLQQGDSLVDVKLTNGKHEMIIGTKKGLAIKFKEQDVRPMGRVAKGVRGMKMGKGDEVIGMESVIPGDTILTVCEEGYGKRTEEEEYRLQRRGGKGVINIRTSKRNGDVVGLKLVKDEDDIILITARGVVVRQNVKFIRTIGRNTQGVRLLKLDEGDKLVSLTRVPKEESLPDE